MKFILGKKKGMTQLFDEKAGRMIPVTTVVAGPCYVTQVKKEGRDTTNAVQIALGTKRSIIKSLAGHLAKSKANRYVREFRLKDSGEAEQFAVGDVITCSQFQEGDSVKVTGVSKGRGFQGVVKRHGFHGSPKSHGHKDQLRMPGSIGATDPARVFKGTRMGGHMGNSRVTVAHLSVIKVEPKSNRLFLKGALPGAYNGLVMLSGEGEMKIEKKIVSKEKEEKKENI